VFWKIKSNVLNFFYLLLTMFYYVSSSPWDAQGRGHNCSHHLNRQITCLTFFQIHEYKDATYLLRTMFKSYFY